MNEHLLISEKTVESQLFYLPPISIRPLISHMSSNSHFHNCWALETLCRLSLFIGPIVCCLLFVYFQCESLCLLFTSTRSTTENHRQIFSWFVCKRKTQQPTRRAGRDSRGLNKVRTGRTFIWFGTKYHVQFDFTYILTYIVKSVRRSETKTKMDYGNHKLISKEKYWDDISDTEKSISNDSWDMFRGYLSVYTDTLYVFVCLKSIEKCSIRSPYFVFIYFVHCSSIVPPSNPSNRYIARLMNMMDKTIRVKSSVLMVSMQPIIIEMEFRTIALIGSTNWHRKQKNLMKKFGTLIRADSSGKY